MKIRLWLSNDQAAVWQNALEVCRRVAGAELDPGRCLELIAAEFLATYAYLAHQQEEPAADEVPEAAESKSEDPDVDRAPDSAAAEGSLEELSSASRGEALVCPENGDLPSPAAVSYSRTWRQVLERDGYQCRYPACSARAALQVHHIEYRSRTGSKGRAENNSPANLITACVFHHRILHSGHIGVKGRAPGELEWRRPELMERVKSRLSGEEIDVEPEDAHLLGEEFDPLESPPGVASD